MDPLGGLALIGDATTAVNEGVDEGVTVVNSENISDIIYSIITGL